MEVVEMIEKKFLTKYIKIYTQEYICIRLNDFGELKLHSSLWMHP